MMPPVSLSSVSVELPIVPCEKDHPDLVELIGPGRLADNGVSAAVERSRLRTLKDNRSADHQSRGVHAGDKINRAQIVYGAGEFKIGAGVYLDETVDGDGRLGWVGDGDAPVSRIVGKGLCRSCSGGARPRRTP